MSRGVGAPASRGPLVALLAATVCALTGRQLSYIAIPWLVLTTTGSAALTGLVTAVAFLPAVVAGLLGGVLIDRVGPRRMAVLANLVSAAGIVMIPLLSVTVGLAFWQLLVFVFIGSLLEIPAVTAGRSMVPELAALARQPLERVNALFESGQHVALLVGTPLAGLLVAWLGPVDVLWLDAAASLLGATILLARVPGTLFARNVVAVTSSFATELLSGLRFIRRDRLLWPMAIMLLLSNGVIGAATTVMLPVYVEEALGSAAALGAAYAAIGAGALVGATVYGFVAGRVSRRLLWSVGYLIIAIDVWVFLLTPGLALLMATFVVSAVVTGPLNPLMVTIRHERIPVALRGRVFSVFSAIAMSAQPLGLLVVGQAIDRLGFAAAVLVFGILAQIVGLGAWLWPAFRRLDAPAAVPDIDAVAIEPVR